MDARRFDQLTRHLLGARTRRAVFGGIAALSLAGPLGLSHDASEAKKRRRKRKKRKPKPMQDAAPPNAFGCINVGDLCQSADQCCSGICEGKQGKRTCRAHGSGGCQAAEICNVFDAEGIPCTTGSGVLGRCGTTTGNAGYCVGAGDCRPCTRDADCHAICGPQAACVQCAEACNVGTVCAGPDGVVCPL